MRTNSLEKEKFFLILLIIAISLIMLNLGIFIGRKEAINSCLWLEKYSLNFAGPKTIAKERPFKDFVRSHGIWGEIIKIDNNFLVIKGKDDLERVILLNTSTIIKFARQSIPKDNLKIGDTIIVIGYPNKDGQINARFIRLFQ